jgi:hypothetical protein
MQQRCPLVIKGIGIVWLDPQRGLEAGKRLIKTAQVMQGCAQKIVRLREAGHQGDGLPDMQFRLGSLRQLLQRGAQVAMGFGISRIQVNGATQGLDCLIEPTRVTQGTTESVPPECVFRVVANKRLCRAEGVAYPTPMKKVHNQRFLRG